MQKLPESERLKMIGLRVHPKTLARLVAHAKARGVPFSEIVREALDAHINRHLGIGKR